MNTSFRQLMDSLEYSLMVIITMVIVIVAAIYRTLSHLISFDHQPLRNIIAPFSGNKLKREFIKICKFIEYFIYYIYMYMYISSIVLSMLL